MKLFQFWSFISFRFGFSFSGFCQRCSSFGVLFHFVSVSLSQPFVEIGLVLVSMVIGLVLEFCFVLLQFFFPGFLWKLVWLGVSLVLVDET